MDIKNKTSFWNRELKKIGVTRLLALSFLVVILLGTILLMLPIANASPTLSFLDNLFIATSATCVTGLTVTTIYEQYSVFGQIVLLVMIQIGGLGLMTFVTILLAWIKHRLNLTEKQLMRDALNKGDLADIPHFIRAIFSYTGFFEIIGFILLAFVFVPEFGMGDGLFKALFTSVSAFCNAGIDNLGATSLFPYATNPIVNLTVMTLIIMGGIGFSVWFNFYHVYHDGLKQKKPLRRCRHNLNVHTKLVISLTLLLLSSGTILFALTEWNNPATLGSYSILEKILISLFQSTTLRTAGFSTVVIGSCHPASLFFMLFYMLIGGSPGGTAGGIKTTTFAMLFIFIFTMVKNDAHINVFHRDIPREIFKRSFAITTFYLVALTVGIFVLCLTENLPFLSLVYEAFSAIGTVGLSTGITPLLSGVGKIVIILLMFLGRVGPFTVMLSLLNIRQTKKSQEFSYPHGDILVG